MPKIGLIHCHWMAIEQLLMTLAALAAVAKAARRQTIDCAASGADDMHGFGHGRSSFNFFFLQHICGSSDRSCRSDPRAESARPHVDPDRKGVSLRTTPACAAH